MNSLNLKSEEMFLNKIESFLIELLFVFKLKTF